MRRSTCVISLDKDPLHTSQNDAIYDPSKTVTGKSGAKRFTFADFCEKCNGETTVVIRPPIKDVARIMEKETSNIVSRANDYGQLKNLKTKLPDCVSNLTDARKFKANWLGLVDASAMSSLTNLEVIDLDENNLLWLPDITGMPNLKSLSMKNNPLRQFECGTEPADFYGTLTRPKVWGKPSEGMDVVASSHIIFKDTDVKTIRDCMEKGTLKYMDQKWGSLKGATAYLNPTSLEERLQSVPSPNPSPSPTKTTPSKSYPKQQPPSPAKSTAYQYPKHSPASYQEPSPGQSPPRQSSTEEPEPEYRSPGNVPTPEIQERNASDTISHCTDIVKLYADQAIILNDKDLKEKLGDDYRRCNNFFNREDFTSTVSGCLSFLKAYNGILRVINDKKAGINFKKCKDFLIKSDPSYFSVSSPTSRGSKARRRS